MVELDAEGMVELGDGVFAVPGHIVHPGVSGWL